MRHPIPLRPSGGDPLAAPGELRIEPLQGWSLPLLNDAAFADLQPLLQRSLLLRQPERLLSALVQRPPLVPEVLVAYETADCMLGVSVVRRLNRSGSCWGVEALRVARTALQRPGSLSGQEIQAGLLREALHRCSGAASWIARCDSTDTDRLALLREQGFQPLRHEVSWLWNAPAEPGPALPPPGDLQLRPLNRRTAGLMLHLEQAACPALLRQLLDRRVEDLLDQSSGPSALWLDPSRQQAVAGVRRLHHQGHGPVDLQLTVHPGWSRLHGPALEHLLIQAVASDPVVRLCSDAGDAERCAWLRSIGASLEGERLLMARSVWRRHEQASSRAANWRLDTVLEPFKPRRRTVPTPAGPSALTPAARPTRALVSASSSALSTLR
ncbi:MULTISPECIES: hypothetical protein [Synechococcales]|uniref:hypothetical protein n=1 Tax=Synechococcus sp. CS-1333 TaxID=2848638 RepID=UPI00223B1EFE|nr:hypothetical protein [Synechococcus sp. CS-1333]MCT0210020.1 hypothetical protein [Synechococcus sp. CS-1333]